MIPEVDMIPEDEPLRRAFDGVAQNGPHPHTSLAMPLTRGTF